jgi:hypothetical protein
MRHLIGIVSAALLLPLWHAISGGHLPAFMSDKAFGIPVATLFVLVEMATLVVLCWLAMKVVARDSIDEQTGGTVDEHEAEQ